MKRRRRAADEYYIDQLVEKLGELERRVPRDIEWRVEGLREDVENYLDPYHDSGDLMVAYNDLYEALMEGGTIEGLERELDEIGDLVDAVHFGDFGKSSRGKRHGGRERHSSEELHPDELAKGDVIRFMGETYEVTGRKIDAGNVRVFVDDPSGGLHNDGTLTMTYDETVEVIEKGSDLMRNRRSNRELCSSCRREVEDHRDKRATTSASMELREWKVQVAQAIHDRLKDEWPELELDSNSPQATLSADGGFPDGTTVRATADVWGKESDVSKLVNVVMVSIDRTHDEVYARLQAYPDTIASRVVDWFEKNL